MKWESELRRRIERELDQLPRRELGTLTRITLHLAIVREPYLSLIINGKKTIESRFSEHHRPPFERIAPGDLVLLKEPAGPIKAVARVRQARFFRRNDSWQHVRNEYGAAMCATDDEFWAARATKGYATLVEIDAVVQLPAIRCQKKDRRGWVILNDRHLW